MNIFKNIFESIIRIQNALFERYHDFFYSNNSDHIDVSQQSEIEKKISERINVFLTDPNLNLNQDEETQDLIKTKTSIELKKQFPTLNLPKNKSLLTNDLEKEVLNMNLKMFNLELKSSKIRRIQKKENSFIDEKIRRQTNLFTNRFGNKKSTKQKKEPPYEIDTNALFNTSVFDRYDSREKERIRLENLLRLDINKLFQKVENSLFLKRFDDAKNGIDEINRILERTNFTDLKAKLIQIRQKHDSKRLEEQQIQQAEILRKKREQEENERKEKEAAIEAERIKALAIRKNEEAKEKEKAARELKKRLQQEEYNREKAEKIRRAKALVEERERENQAILAEKERALRERAEANQRYLSQLITYKSNWKEYERVLQNNHISTLYHFTDRANISSIKRNGGLFSWHYCDNNGIDITYPGGGPLSRELDLRYDLQDYVRVCFTRNHPMMFVAQNEGRIPNPIILTIDMSVCYYKNTRFADMNAAKTGHNCGDTLDDLKKIKFSLVRLSKHFDIPDENDRKYYQAEVLVKSWIPINAITNINEF